MPLSVMWRITVPWYADRLDPDFRRKPLDTYQAILSDAGLTGPFWNLM